MNAGDEARHRLKIARGFLAESQQDETDAREALDVAKTAVSIAEQIVDRATAEDDDDSS